MSVYYAHEPVLDVVLGAMALRDGRGNSTGILLYRFPEVLASHVSTRSDLLAQKPGVVAQLYPGYAHIAFDPCLYDAGVANTSKGVILGQGRAYHTLLPGGSLVTIPLVPQSIASTSTTAPATSFVVHWETFTYEDSDPAGDIFTRTYVECPASDLSCEVSVDGGLTFLPGSCGCGVVTAGGPPQALRFRNTKSTRRGLAYWSVLTP